LLSNTDIFASVALFSNPRWRKCRSRRICHRARASFIIDTAPPRRGGVRMCPLETQPLVRLLFFHTERLFSIDTDSSASLRDAGTVGRL
jgi:hypothetical protein